MPKNFENLNEDLSLVSGLVPLVQIDVMDGAFVPNKTWPYMKSAPGSEPAGDPDFAKILHEEGGFPLWEELDFEADLMVANPGAAAKEWITAGAKRIILHVESMGDAGAAKAFVQEIKNSLPSRDSFFYTEIGVALNPETSNEVLEPLMEYIDFVQFMGIAKIGFQGQPFDERVLEKISRLRAAHPNVTISVDGGVNFETAKKLIEAGANRLVIGSAIFESDDIPAAIDEFFHLVS